MRPSEYAIGSKGQNRIVLILSLSKDARRGRSGGDMAFDDASRRG
jgi:hypothetical protein